MYIGLLLVSDDVICYCLSFEELFIKMTGLHNQRRIQKGEKSSKVLLIRSKHNQCTCELEFKQKKIVHSFQFLIENILEVRKEILTQILKV